MKQVNVLMEESLLEHLEKLSQVISLLSNKKITVSDVVRKAVTVYSKYGQVVIESKLSENKEIKIEVKPSTINGYTTLPNDELMS